MKTSQKQSGFTLLEIAVVLAVMAVLAQIAIQALSDEAFNLKASTIAGQMRTITGGTGTMMSGNFEALAGGAPVAGFLDPYNPTVPELRAKGYLANNVLGSNIAGTNWRIKINRVPAGCVAPSCDLSALIYTDRSFLRRDGQPDIQLAVKVSEKANTLSGTNDAGTSLDSAPGTISGPNGTWTTTNPAGAVQAVVAMQTGFGSQGFSQFIRQGDSRPVMLGNSLSVAGNTGISGILTVNSPSSFNNSLAVGGTFIANGPGSFNNSLSVGGTFIANGPTGMNGSLSVRGPTYLNYASTGSLDVSGNLNVYGPNANVNNINATTINATNITASNQVQMAQGYVTGVAVEGGVCGPNGIIKQSGTGLILSCQSGIWKVSAGSARMGSFQLMMSPPNQCRVANKFTGTCTCPVGSTPELVHIADVYTVATNWTYDEIYECN